MKNNQTRRIERLKKTEKLAAKSLGYLALLFFAVLLAIGFGEMIIWR